jgi:hypothetical protein
MTALSLQWTAPFRIPSLNAQPLAGSVLVFLPLFLHAKGHVGVSAVAILQNQKTSP